jgi:hypothetical protein
LLSLIERDWDLFADTAAHQWLGWPAGGGRAREGRPDLESDHAADRP